MTIILIIFDNYFERLQKYRFILAVDIGTENCPDQEYENNDAIINEGLRISLSASAPEKSGQTPGGDVLSGSAGGSREQTCNA